MPHITICVHTAPHAPLWFSVYSDPIHTQSWLFHVTVTSNPDGTLQGVPVQVPYHDSVRQSRPEWSSLSPTPIRLFNMVKEDAAVSLYGVPVSRKIATDRWRLTDII